MVLLGITFVVAMAIAAECQVIFPNDPTATITTRHNGNDDSCTASNGQTGTCYEYRSTKFKECSSFYPSLNTGIPAVNQHLTANLCRNTGREVYFCCPSVTTRVGGRPDVIPKEAECGISQSYNVVGGELTSRGEWPWLAALGLKRASGFTLFCGGTLITKQHVISAAHCFKSQVLIQQTTVRLGEFNTDIDGDGAKDYTIADHRMDNYNTNTKENDIVILKLDRPLDPFTDNIRPACLPYHLRNENFEGKRLVVVGWGVFDNRDRRTSPVPLRAVVPVVPVQECQQKYQNTNSRNKIDDRQLCAGKNGTDSCSGDSGGPINYTDTVKGRFYVVGVVSFGPVICGNTNLPGVYARVGNYLDWIENSIRKMQ